jgi:hypothetical protein
MSQRINHRRGEDRHQDNGPRWENGNPMAGCNSTHVAKARSSWRTLGRRLERRTGRHTGVMFHTGGGKQIPTIEDQETNDTGQ